MRQPPANTPRSRHKPPTREQASVRIILLALACFLAGIAVGGLWFRGAISTDAQNAEARPDSEAPIVDAAPTNAALKAQDATPPPKPPVPVSAAKPADTEAVKRLIPNLDAVSVQEGTRILRQAALKEFTTVAKDMENQVNAAQQRLRQAQTDRSEAGQEAAMKHLQQVQAAQVERLKQISAELQAQIAALERLKRQ